MNLDPALVIGCGFVAAAGYAIILGNLAFYRRQVAQLRNVVKEQIASELKESLHNSPAMSMAVVEVEQHWEEMVETEPSLHDFLSARDKMDIVVLADRMMEK